VEYNVHSVQLRLFFKIKINIHHAPKDGQDEGFGRQRFLANLPEDGHAEAHEDEVQVKQNADHLEKVPEHPLPPYATRPAINYFFQKLIIKF
jgi:hypothetical protein